MRGSEPPPALVKERASELELELVRAQVRAPELVQPRAQESARVVALLLALALELVRVQESALALAQAPAVAAPRQVAESEQVPAPLARASPRALPRPSSWPVFQPGALEASRFEWRC